MAARSHRPHLEVMIGSARCRLVDFLRVLVLARGLVWGALLVSLSVDWTVKPSALGLSDGALYWCGCQLNKLLGVCPSDTEDVGDATGS